MICVYIQKELLDEAAKMLPNELWWIKSDGCDVVAGLTESMRGQWSGDIDLGDGSLQKQFKDYTNYTNRIELINGVTQPVGDFCQSRLRPRHHSPIP